MNENILSLNLCWQCGVWNHAKRISIRHGLVVQLYGTWYNNAYYERIQYLAYSKARQIDTILYCINDLAPCSSCKKPISLMFHSHLYYKNAEKSAGVAG
jgi:hypothetical protein